MSKTTIKIGDKDVDMIATAGTSVVYMSVFHEDLLRKVQEKDPGAEFVQRLAFVMASSAKMKAEEVMRLTQADYLNWLADFGPLDILLATEDIINFYFAQTKPLSVPKKLGG